MLLLLLLLFVLLVEVLFVIPVDVVKVVPFMLFKFALFFKLALKITIPSCRFLNFFGKDKPSTLIV